MLLSGPQHPPGAPFLPMRVKSTARLLNQPWPIRQLSGTHHKQRDKKIKEFILRMMNESEENCSFLALQELRDMEFFVNDMIKSFSKDFC